MRDLDEIAIERAVTGGDRVHLHPTEREEAVRRLNARGLVDTQIAERLHVALRTVRRIRKRCGIPPAVRPGQNRKAPA